jgi:hypothetical protein
MGNRLKRWFFEGMRQPAQHSPHQSAWWNVMCLTGVDYFSTLGYQPGIAFLAAGLLSPVATLVLVLVTLFGALPVYSAVAKESPHGQGSISMLERLLPGWRGKTLVLILLGFAATDFVITITLSAADATAHIIENPFVRTHLPAFLTDRVGVTTLLLAALAGIFLAGFREAIGVSVLLVTTYLLLNALVVGASLNEIVLHHHFVSNWQAGVVEQFKTLPKMIGISLLLFPKLALGLSGFETGVAVMPLVKGYASDDPEEPAGRVRNTRKLLLTAAILMSIFLIASSIATTLMIPPAEFQEGGKANGRAISYLAHHFFPVPSPYKEIFGTMYDISSIAILWFAGASAMAGLLNLVPRYLPRYGMAPDWARATRPLVVFFAAVSFAVTFIFNADVDAQAGAYATGVLVLITSASFAVTLNRWKTRSPSRFAYALIAAVFVYTSLVNMHERPEGLHIAAFFIGTILIVSVISRAARSLELRILSVAFDTSAEQFIREAITDDGVVCLLAHRPGARDHGQKEAETRLVHKLTEHEARLVFLEVELRDPSEFIDDEVLVRGEIVDGYKILKCDSPAIPNAIAAILLTIRDRFEVTPHCYFGWTEGQPIAYVFKYIFLGEGETAPVTREILREQEKRVHRRPKIIVG